MPPTKPTLSRSKPQPELVEAGVSTIFSTRLLFWRKMADTVWLTFVEDRPEVPDAELLKSHVVARVAMPASSLGATTALLQEALSKSANPTERARPKLN